MPKIKTKTKNHVITFTVNGELKMMKDGEDVPRETLAAAQQNEAVKKMLADGVFAIEDDPNAARPDTPDGSAKPSRRGAPDLGSPQRREG